MHERATLLHPTLGEYEQCVFGSVEEAGHRKLASEGKYGWEMPTDPATERYITKASRGKVIVDLGCGLGNTVSLPCLAEGSSLVYALDVSREHVDEDSFLVKEAIKNGWEERLITGILDPRWWGLTVK